MLVPDLAAAATRWPAFAAAASRRGARAVHALPLALQGRTYGTLGLLRAGPGPVDDDDLHLAESLAHTALVALVARRAAEDQDTLTDQLQRALLSRIVIEQAKGILSASAGLDMDQAFSALRRYARDHNAALADVSRDLTTRRRLPEHVVGHAGPPPPTSSGAPRTQRAETQPAFSTASAQALRP